MSNQLHFGITARKGISMKKMVCIFLLIVLFCSTFACSSDTGNERVVFLSDFIHCDQMDIGSSFAFNLTYVYKDKKPEITLVSFGDSNLDAIFERMRNEVSEEQSKPYNEFKGGFLAFKFDTSSMGLGSNFAIDHVILNVDGKEKTVCFSDPVKYTRISPEDPIYQVDSVYGVNIPFIVTGNVNPGFVSFVYQTDVDEVIIDSFEFNNYLTIEHSNVILNEINLGVIEDVFPLKVPANSVLKIDIGEKFEGENADFSCYLINSILRFHSEKDGNGVLNDFIIFDRMKDYEDFTNMIDYIESNS